MPAVSGSKNIPNFFCIRRRNHNGNSHIVPESAASGHCGHQIVSVQLSIGGRRQLAFSASQAAILQQSFQNHFGGQWIFEKCLQLAVPPHQLGFIFVNHRTYGFQCRYIGRSVTLMALGQFLNCGNIFLGQMGLFLFQMADCGCRQQAQPCSLDIGIQSVEAFGRIQIADGLLKGVSFLGRFHQVQQWTCISRNRCMPGQSHRVALLPVRRMIFDPLQPLPKCFSSRIYFTGQPVQMLGINKICTGWACGVFTGRLPDGRRLVNIVRLESSELAFKFRPQPFKILRRQPPQQIRHVKINHRRLFAFFGEPSLV